MILFGWGYQTIKNFGPAFENMCGNCNNNGYWILTRTMTWFTLFFIPVFPYKIEYFLACQVCQYGVTLKSKQVQEIKPIAESNQLLIDGKITENEYKYRVNNLPLDVDKKEDTQKKPAKKQIENKNIDDIQYCTECGAKIKDSQKFCGSCGIKTSPK